MIKLLTILSKDVWFVLTKMAVLVAEVLRIPKKLWSFVTDDNDYGSEEEKLEKNRYLLMNFFVSWFLALSLVLLVTTRIPVFLGGVLIAGFCFFTTENGRGRVIVSCLMLVALTGFTYYIAKMSAVPLDPSNWLFSKIIFVAFFGVFGSEIVNQIDWSKDILARYELGDWTKRLLITSTIVGSLLLIWLAFYFKFGGNGPEKIAIITTEMCNAGAKCVGVLANPDPVYQVKDWREDVLFGIAMTWFSVIVPTVLVTQTNSQVHPPKQQ